MRTQKKVVLTWEVPDQLTAEMDAYYLKALMDGVKLYLTSQGALKVKVEDKT